MKIIVLYVLLIICIPLKGQIYSSKHTYTFQYNIKDKNNIQNNGTILLNCYGIKSKIDSTQYLISWSTDQNLQNKFSKKGNPFYTGVIENNSRVWIHPPRSDLFTILEYSPFPEVRIPLKIGLRWQFKNSMGRFWENKLFDIKSNDILIYKYVIEDVKHHICDLESFPIQCYSIKAESVNIKFAQTKFSGLYNDKYGFIDMEFQNIDGSTILLKLIKVN